MSPVLPLDSESSASASPKESECFKRDALTVNLTLAAVAIRVLGSPPFSLTLWKMKRWLEDWKNEEEKTKCEKWVKTGTSWHRDIWRSDRTQRRKENQQSYTLWFEISCFFHRILFLLHSQTPTSPQLTKKKKNPPHLHPDTPPSLPSSKNNPTFLASSSSRNLLQVCSWSSSAGPSGTGLTGRWGRGMHHCQAKCRISVFGLCQTPPQLDPNPYQAGPEETAPCPGIDFFLFFYGGNKETLSITWYIIITSFVTLSPQMYRKQAVERETRKRRMCLSQPEKALGRGDLLHLFTHPWVYTDMKCWNSSFFT